ncbi:MAG: head GIN domain-containing protein [Flavobacterium sp.]|uniref:head GIN domain-containing protein n=1 Tax=Flavobacterium sp. TaxID=239 RepID=UPI003267B99A
MLKIIVSATAILSSLAAFSQVSENRTVADFSKLKTSASVHVYYTVSNAKTVKVETDDNEKMKFIKTEVENGSLNIFVDSAKGKVHAMRFKILNIYVSGPSLTSVKASSSSKIKFENQNSADHVDVAVSSSAGISGEFNCSEINIDASSSGKLSAKVNAKSAEVETSSSADVNLNGKTDTLKVKSSSSSSCNADKLIAEDVTANASSSADINVYASKSLNAKASSSADINYYGNPSQVVADKSSSGSVNKK